MKTEQDNKISLNLYPIEEAAAKVKVKVSLLRSEIFKGNLKPIKAGRLLRFNDRILMNWLKEK